MIFRRIETRDVYEAAQLFRTCIADLLAREDMSDPQLQQQETDRLIGLMNRSLNDKSIRFFVAENSGRVTGTIALLPPGNIIADHVEFNAEILEVSCVYVHPACQRNGVGSFLFSNILDELRKIGSEHYCLDAGFSSSQRYWLTKLGSETHLLEDYWGSGQPHRIWQMKIDG